MLTSISSKRFTTPCNQTRNYCGSLSIFLNKQRLRELQQKNHSFEQSNIDLYISKQSENLKKLPSTKQFIKNNTRDDAISITVQKLSQIQFPVLDYTIKDLIEFSVKIFMTSQFCRLNFSQKILRKVVKLIASNYRSIAYHNFSHGFSLMLLNFQCFSAQKSLKYIFNQEQYFYILVAGLAHDLNHPGTSNGFQNKIKSDLSTQSSGLAVLENMHIRHLWKILQENPDLNLIDVSKNKSKAKQMITRLILATDMSLHFKCLQNFKNMKSDPTFDPKRNQEHKWIVMQQIVHACDIGNACYDYENVMSWGALLSLQFAQLAQLQQKNGLEVTKMLLIPDARALYKDQISFINTFTLPLWKQISQYYLSISPWTKNIQKNVSKFKQELQMI